MNINGQFQNLLAIYGDIKREKGQEIVYNKQ